MDIADEKCLLHRDNPTTISDKWVDYVGGNSLFTNNADSISRRLQEEKKRLFMKEEKMEVDVLNILSTILKLVGRGRN